METCDIYITNLVYDEQSWLDNPDYLLESIYNNLNDIKDFIFTSLNLNMAQVFNVSLQSSNYDSMILYIKGTKYKHTEFLALDTVKELEREIRKQISYIDKLYIGEIQFRISKMYTDHALGLI